MTGAPAAAAPVSAAAVAPEAGEKFSGQKPLPTKKVRDRNFSGQRQTTSSLPTKKTEFAHQNIEQKTGWIEFPKQGTKNPKRYARRRRWIRDSGGGWKKSQPRRLKSIPPMTEEDYVKYKDRQQKSDRIEKRTRRRNRGH